MATKKKSIKPEPEIQWYVESVATMVHATRCDKCGRVANPSVFYVAEGVACCVKRDHLHINCSCGWFYPMETVQRKIQSAQIGICSPEESSSLTKMANEYRSIQGRVNKGARTVSQ